MASNSARFELPATSRTAPLLLAIAVSGQTARDPGGVVITSRPVGGNIARPDCPRRFRLGHGPEKAGPALDAGWVPVSRLREAAARFIVRLDASAGEGRSEKDRAPRRS